jgi:hypothetical protein
VLLGKEAPRNVYYVESEDMDNESEASCHYSDIDRAVNYSSNQKKSDNVHYMTNRKVTQPGSDVRDSDGLR